MLKAFFAFAIGLLEALIVPLLAYREGVNSEKIKNSGKVLDDVERANADADAFLEYKLLNRREPLVLRDNTSPPPE